MSRHSESQPSLFSADHPFGGDWTEQKLDMLRQYLQQYNIALKNQPFQRIYIDAFAGTGYRNASGAAQGDQADQLSMFEEPASRALLDGSVSLALQTDPPFHQFYFIERDAARCESLAALKLTFPTAAEKIIVRNGDANEEIATICQAYQWKYERAVLFLDPYGLQVRWTTIEKIADTRAIDLWWLVPIGIGFNRMLTRSGRFPPGWEATLDVVFGDPKWRTELYATHLSTNLFGETVQTQEKASINAISVSIIKRLKKVFPAVAENPRLLRNSTGSPMYLLCFASANPSAKAIRLSLEIAEYILDENHAQKRRARKA
jgi:three-Cys-motif partner protein